MHWKYDITYTLIVILKFCTNVLLSQTELGCQAFLRAPNILDKYKTQKA